MDDWFSVIASDLELPSNAAQELCEIGFIIIQGAVAPAKVAARCRRLPRGVKAMSDVAKEESAMISSKLDRAAAMNTRQVIPQDSID